MSIASSNTPERMVLTPSQLNSEVRQLLERGLPPLWVEGEISNLARPRSGHLYFSLKDAGAQVRCAMFRNRNQLLRFQPESGQQVLVRARISVYEPRGEYQLIIEHMEEAGHGAMQRAFEELKAKLQSEGLFDPARKKSLPAMPRRIGLVTSPSGAAIRDVLATFQRRFPGIEVIVYPSQVQGKEAPAQLVRAIETAGRRREVDILIISRGGGSLEDLMAFNDEAVARAIAASPLPTVSGVGHEVDTTIADFVADVRAPTPTGAAELVTPDGMALASQLVRHADRLRTAVRRRLREWQQSLGWLRGRLHQQHPGQQLRQRSQRLDELEMRLRRNLYEGIRNRRHRLATAAAELRRHDPSHRVAGARQKLAEFERRLRRLGSDMLRERGQALAATSRALHAVSPLATLDRGYAIVQAGDGDTLVRSVGQVTPGDRLVTQLRDGRLYSTVTKKEDS